MRHFFALSPFSKRHLSSLQECSPNRAGSNFIRRWLAIFILILIGPLSIGGWVLGLHVTGNVHVVEPGALYRSAQLDGPGLDAIINKYAIRTVINLRGPNKGQSWYDDEIAESRKDGVSHIDIRMSARSKPAASTIKELLAALRSAPKPILIHCKDGADRTGLAAALYEFLIAGQPREAAARQLSFRYGHFPWLGSATAAMDQSFDEIVAGDSPTARASGDRPN
ncbi:dual specificity protein phosphatase family protein [Rhodoblastus sp.]|uniref:dual specificity protein phosphatase family protein n=1 Tax=Rhodoblastus sp. TaxID=1962975 RepID=UPI002608D881|nr:dual specificity protein phosphatase family protein [Rhodoblastus sp.]